MKLNYRNEKNAKFISNYYNIPLEKREWFNVENSTEGAPEILIFGYIGWPFNDVADFAKAMSDMKKERPVVRINSPGGDVWDANAAHNIIKGHPLKPITRIESLAASAASYIAIAGHERQAYKNSTIMIHEPMTGFWGNQYEFADVIAVLQQISGTMIDMYADNTNVGKRELKDMLKAETWMTAKVAKEKGFIDTIIEAGNPVSAKFDLSMFANIPDEFKPVAEIPKDPTIRDIENLLRDVGGLSKDKAKAVLARGWKAISEDNNFDGVIDVAKQVLTKFK